MSVSFSLPFDHVAMHREDETSLLFEAILLLDKVVSGAGTKANECLTAMAAAKIKKKK